MKSIVLATLYDLIPGLAPPPLSARGQRLLPRANGQLTRRKLVYVRLPARRSISSMTRASCSSRSRAYVSES